MKYFVGVVSCLALALAVMAFIRSAPSADASAAAAAAAAARPAVAGVVGACFPSGTSSIKKSFNSVNSFTPTITSASGPGRCTVNFGFQVKNRYFSISSDAVDGSLFAIEKTGNNSITVYPRSITTGDDTWGTFYLLVY